LKHMLAINWNTARISIKYKWFSCLSYHAIFWINAFCNTKWKFSNNISDAKLYWSDRKTDSLYSMCTSNMHKSILIVYQFFIIFLAILHMNSTDFCQTFFHSFLVRIELMKGLMLRLTCIVSGIYRQHKWLTK
jgi:hypothetical protein